MDGRQSLWVRLPGGQAGGERGGRSGCDEGRGANVKGLTTWSVAKMLRESKKRALSLEAAVLRCLSERTRR